MAGMNRHTGRWLSGWAHLAQSIGDIFMTRITERVFRRTYGSGATDILGRENLTRGALVRLWMVIYLALTLWEPRFRLRRFVIPAPENTPERFRQGKVSLGMYGDYMPRGHLGDFTVEAENVSFFVAANGQVLP